MGKHLARFRFSRVLNYILCVCITAVGDHLTDSRQRCFMQIYLVGM